MEPIIREENNIYAVGYSYEADWRKLCRVKDRAAYWSAIDLSNSGPFGQDAYVQAIRNLWQYFFKEWFPGSGYHHDDEKCNFEVYSGNMMQIYVPVR